MKEGDLISPINTLPVLSDLVVRRDKIARQMRNRLISFGKGNDLNVDPPEDYNALTACIECYACLQGCPMHEQNFNEETAENEKEGYLYGNPFSLLKLQVLRLDPLNTQPGRDQALEHAKELGLQMCVQCEGCKCGIGIDLMGKVVRPLLVSLEEG